MALINCPNCGKEISDKAIVCPGCGAQIYKNEDTIICSECGYEYSKILSACPNCGNPTVEEKEETKKKKSPAKIIITLIIIIGIIAAGVIYVKDTLYKENMKNAINDIIKGGQLAEQIVGLEHDVWANCIYKEKDKTTDKYTRKKSGKGEFYSDFNDALEKLYNDEDFIEEIEELNENYKELAYDIQKLKNPSSRNRDGYNKITEAYSDYISLYNLAIDSTGMNIKEFTDEINEADKKAAKSIQETLIYIN